MVNMEFSVIEENGVRLLEGPPDEPCLARVKDNDRLIEACFSDGADTVLLYARNLTDGFFDLSSGEAGAILQKLRQYQIRLMVVCPPGSVQFSSRFGEMVADESRGRHFRIFETRHAALAWLGGLS